MNFDTTGGETARAMLGLADKRYEAGLAAGVREGAERALVLVRRLIEERDKSGAMIRPADLEDIRLVLDLPHS